MSELGAYLRRHREERGWSLDEVEAETRIRRRYLEAMEAGEWDELPPGVYTRGLLRNYARALGVSVGGVARMYVKERPSEARPPEPQLISQPLVNEPRFNLELALAAVLLVVAVGLIAWVLGTQLPTYLGSAESADATAVRVASTSARTPTTEPTSSVPQGRATARPAGSGVADAPAGAAAGTTTPGTTADAPAGMPAGGTAAAGTEAAGPEVARTATGEPTGPSVGEATAAGVGSGATPTRRASPTPRQVDGLVLEVEAVADSWVLVRADGREAYSGFIRKGESHTWSANSSVSLRTGNAGGTQVTVNGNRIPALGDLGDVEEREWRLLPSGDIEQREL